MLCNKVLQVNTVLLVLV